MEILIELLLLLIVAAVAGAIGQLIAGYSTGGCLVSIALGFIGALIGYWIARGLDLPTLIPIQIGETTFPLIWAIIGAALFVAVVRLIAGSRRT